MGRFGYDIRFIIASVAAAAAGFSVGGLWSYAVRAEQAVAANAAVEGAASQAGGTALPTFVPNEALLSGSGAGEGKNGENHTSKQQTITIEPDPRAAALPPSKEPAAPAPPPPVAANTLFGAAKSGAPLAARAIGTYARGCLSGGVQLESDGPAWQAMRLSRNRQWGHPRMVALVERLAKEAKKLDGWPGLLVGDIAQPRGGPMLTGHRSHQVGLDADVWLTPMPDRKLSYRERETLSATSMLDKTDIAVDPKVFTDKQVALIKRAASYPEVERIFVHPAIKKALCGAAGQDRGWLGKVRPMGGHYYHFHIRIKCPPGYAGCKPQAPPTGEDGCTTEVENWLARLTPPKTPPPPKPPGYKPKPKAPPITLAQLPAACTAVLQAGRDGVAIPAGSAPAKPSVAVSIGIKSPALRPHVGKALAGQAK